MIEEFYKRVDINGDKKISKREIEVLINKTFTFAVNKNKSWKNNYLIDSFNFYVLFSV